MAQPGFPFRDAGPGRRCRTVIPRSDSAQRSSRYPSGSSYHNYGNLLQVRRRKPTRRAWRIERRRICSRSRQSDPDALANACRAQTNSGNECKVYATLRAAFQRSEAASWNSLGVLEMTAHRPQEALKAFGSGIAADPLSIPIVYNRYVLRSGKLSRDDIKRERDDLKKALAAKAAKGADGGTDVIRATDSMPEFFVLATLGHKTRIRRAIRQRKVSDACRRRTERTPSRGSDCWGC